MASISLVRQRSDIVIAEEEIQVIRGTTITITVTMLQNGSYGDPVQNQRIYYYDQTFNTLLGSQVTNQYGIASLDWVVPKSHALGPTVINATYYGNDSLSLLPSYQRISLLIMSQTFVQIDDNISNSLAPGDILSFSVHLIDDTNMSVPNAELSLLVDTAPLTIGITNVTGYVDFEIECNNTWLPLGEHHIQVLYNQDLTNFLNGSQFVFTLEIAQLPTHLIFDSVFPNEIEINTALNLYLTLFDTTNSTIPNGPLEVTMDDTHLDFVISNVTGQINCFIMIDERFTLGIHSLRIQYNGTDRYSDSSIDALISITSPIMLATQISEDAVIGSLVHLEFTVTDILSRPIPYGTLFLSDITSNQSFLVSIEDKPVVDFLYYIEAPLGIHNLTIDILDNPFIRNTRYTANFTAWSRPEIVLVNTGIEHYASPNQELSFEAKLIDWNGICSFRLIQLLVDNEILISNVTDTEGLTVLTFLAPINEGQHNISIVYSGNLSRYELAVLYNYNFIVTTLMPIQIKLSTYEMIIPLHEISVQLTVRGLNGSLLPGVTVNFSWLSINFTSESLKEGLLDLHLAIPTESGSYPLYYESESSSSVDSVSGSIMIEISADEILSTEGVGITGIIVAVIASIGIVSVPVIRRRYIIG
ncbi:MAG: hypothetical protein ACFFCP_05410 [Promethearchaeota archaeon]